MKLLKNTLKIGVYIILIIFVSFLTMPYLLDKSKCLFAETRLLVRLKEANNTKNLLLLDGIAFEKEIFNQASKLICQDYNYDNFIYELNEANKTKNKKRLMELDLQSHRCINDKNLSNKIQKEFELYKLYWRNNE